MELHQFKEILLEFLDDITNIPERNKIWFLDEEGAKEPYNAPLRYKVFSPYVLVRIVTASKVPEGPKPELEEGQEIVEEEPKEEIYLCRVKFKIYTEANIFYITGVWKDYQASYLGCQVNNRKSRAGEDWIRGSDLPDGYFSKETWNRIKNFIIRYEMKALSKYIEHGHWQNPSEAEVFKPSKHSEKIDESK